MVKIAVLDDWQDVARQSADWSALDARADLVFFADAFGTEDQAAAALADVDILLTMRERTALPGSLIARLPKLRMIGITGASNATLDLEACGRHGIVVCNTAGGPPAAPWATAELALGLLIAAARAIPAADAGMRAGGFQHGLPTGLGLAGKVKSLAASGFGPAFDGDLAAACVDADDDLLRAERLYQPGDEIHRLRRARADHHARHSEVERGPHGGFVAQAAAEFARDRQGAEDRVQGGLVFGAGTAGKCRVQVHDVQVIAALPFPSPGQRRRVGGIHGFRIGFPLTQPDHLPSHQINRG